MSFRIVYSRPFLEKIHGWKPAMRRMALEAAEHAALDPTLHDYKRPYLTPYRQKHPTTDHQYTLYFLENPHSKTIFVAWINDPTCLHDTRNALTDPCLKEFKRLEAAGDIEKYDPAFHEPRFEINPDKTKPLRCRSTLLGSEITLNSYSINRGEFIGHAFSFDEPVEGIAIEHCRWFLHELHQMLTSQNFQFRFEFTRAGHEAEARLLVASHSTKDWEIVDDQEDFILKKL